jgi:hypothetical protein
VLLGIALVGLGIDLWDGYWPKTLSSALIVTGLVALLLARRFQSSRWRMIMLLSLSLAVAVMLARFLNWQGWV